MIESGRSNPPIGRLPDICQAYELPPEWSAVIIRYIYGDTWKAITGIITGSLFTGISESAELERQTEILLKKYAEKFKITLPEVAV
jgi:hypothetical protein